MSFNGSAKNKSNLHIVVGCGRLGSNIATILSSNGKDVVVIDNDPDAFRKLGSEFSGFTVEADGIDVETLEKTGVENALAVIAVTEKDNVNLMVAQIAKSIFDSPLVIARLYDPDKEIILNGTGIKTIYPNKLSLAALEHMIAE